MANFKEIWKRACESGKMGEILDEFGKKYEERKAKLKEEFNKQYELALRVGEERFGGACLHTQVKNGVCEMLEKGNTIQEINNERN